MTVSISGTVSAGDGCELEVIEANRGLEQRRFRVGNGSPVSLSVHEATTLVLLEVKTDAKLAPLPGALAHGDMTAPGEVSQDGLNSRLVDGDLDAKGAELQEIALYAQERALTVLHQFLATEGQPVQEDFYSELRQAHRAYADALAEFEAHYLAVAE